MKKEVDLIVFDLDGTLVDSIGDLTDALNHAATVMGRPIVPDNKVLTYIGDGARALISRGLKLEMGSVELIRAEKAFMSFYGNNLSNRTIFYPNVKHILSHFGNKKLAILSNKPDAFTQKVIQEMKLTGIFDMVLGSSDNFRRKPEPDALIHIIEKLGAEPHKTIMVGDGDTDIKAGKAAGTLTCALSYGYRPVAELEALLPDFMIGDLGELKNIIS